MFAATIVLFSVAVEELLLQSPPPLPLAELPESVEFVTVSVPRL